MTPNGVTFLFLSEETRVCYMSEETPYAEVVSCIPCTKLLCVVTLSLTIQASLL